MPIETLAAALADPATTLTTGEPLLRLDLIETTAFAGVALFCGYGARRAAPILGRYNVPAPVIGGLLVAAALTLARRWNVTLVEFDATLQRPLMNAFFTSIGFGVSVRVLRRGGWPVLELLVLSTLAAALQNVLGPATAWLLGQKPLFGVLCGSLTLAGGPATAMAFAPQFEEAGIAGAPAFAMAAALLGIVAAGLLGAPIATVLIEALQRRRQPTDVSTPAATEIVERQLPGSTPTMPVGEHTSSYAVMKTAAVLLLAMWIGGGVSRLLTDYVMTFPIYIGGMITAAVIRNVDDLTGWFGLSQRIIDEIGNVALAFFLTMALMTLELWRLASVALPLVALVLVQIGVMVAFCVWPVFVRFGRNYDAAVIAGGFFGYMIGTTPNAMASMDSLVRRYGPSPLAYLTVPVVGAFFIDFTNALLIQGSLNLMGG